MSDKNQTTYSIPTSNLNTNAKSSRLELKDKKLYLDGKEMPGVTNIELICENNCQPYIKLSMLIPLDKKGLELKATVYER